MSVTVISILLPILLIFIIGFGFYSLMKRKPGKQRRWFSNKKIYLILAGYIVILMISTGVYYLLPTNEMTVDEDILTSIDEIHKESEEVYNLAYEGDFEKIDEKFIKEKSSIPFEYASLEIDETIDLSGHWIILVERKETDDNKIDLTVYETPSRMNGVNVSEYLGQEEFTIESKRLRMTRENNVQELSFSQFSKPSFFYQFSDEKDIRMHFDYSSGSKILHLNIPAGLEIINEYNGFIHYLDGEQE